MRSNIDIKPLKKLAKKIFSGAPIYSIAKLQHSPNGVPILNIKNISDGKVSLENSLRLSIENFKTAERYIVFPGDVLIACRGTQLKVGIVPKDAEKILITSNLIAIRLNGDVSPEFLVAYFQSQKGQKALLSRATSSIIQLVLNVSDVQDTEIPVPPLSLQEKIANISVYANEQYRISLETAQLRKNISDQVIAELLSK
jgi:restriction endonuclease S subunit